MGQTKTVDENLECYSSRLKLLGLLGLTIALVGMFYFLTTLPDVISRVVGWIGIAFFGLGFVAFPVMLFRTGPQVIINDRGIEDRRMKIGVIPWEDIRSVSVGSVNSAKFLVVEPLDRAKYVSRLPRKSRWLIPVSNALRLPALAISFSGLSPGLKEVWAYVRERHAQFASEHTPLEPESRFIVRLSDSEVICERPDGKVERVSWADLRKVEVVTTSDGPVDPDVFWVLHGAEGGCAIPQGATGDRELLHRLQELPGFNNGAVIEAMSSSSDRRFLCWQREHDHAS